MKNDLEIQQDVINELKWQPFLAASNIGVSAKGGIVTLYGQVDSYAQKLAAEKAAKKVIGVRAIADDIQIGVSPTYHKTDAEIAESVLNALKWHSAVPDQKIKIKVEGGDVTLEGEVEWEYQRGSAYEAVSNIIGVRNVWNNITIKSKASITDIKSKINAALHRAATIDAEKISVEVVGTKVILTGSVRSHAEKEDAEEAAWSAPGITSIESRITVEPELELTF